MTMEELDQRLKQAKNDGRIDCDDIGVRELPVRRLFENEWRLTEEVIYQAWAWKDGKGAIEEMVPQLLEQGSPDFVVQAVVEDLSAELSHP